MFICLEVRSSWREPVLRAKRFILTTSLISFTDNLYLRLSVKDSIEEEMLKV